MDAAASPVTGTRHRNRDRTGRIGLVPSRFGTGLVGGAEIVLAQMSRRLLARGWDVEILTTCALDHFGWENVLPAGSTVEDGLPVRRFLAVTTPGSARGDLEHAILSGAEISLGDQQRWVNAGMRCPGLYHHLLDHAHEYRAILFTPYANWITFACSQVSPERSVLWTCLHDEPYAYLDLFQPLLTGVGGLLFQTAPEHELAHRLVRTPAPHALVGCGVEVPQRYDPEGFRRRHGIEGRFLLYAGRREGAKGWATLLEQFAGAVLRRGVPFQLVTMGRGDVRAPAAIADRVVDLGFLADDERDSAFAAAEAYIQPSRYEAFSRTIMEAWLAGTPVIANGDSDVVRYHCERSGAGLVYRDEFELEECLAFLAEAPDVARELAATGRQYVLDNYRWDIVLDRIEVALSAWTA
jgi:glycosyltransferase involved in cell wall biosynthesis